MTGLLLIICGERLQVLTKTPYNVEPAVAVAKAPAAGPYV
jgi:hypothetical protein